MRAFCASSLRGTSRRCVPQLRRRRSAARSAHHACARRVARPIVRRAVEVDSDVACARASEVNASRRASSSCVRLDVRIISRAELFCGPRWNCCERSISPEFGHLRASLSIVRRGQRVRHRSSWRLRTSSRSAVEGSPRAAGRSAVCAVALVCSRPRGTASPADRRPPFT